MHGFEHFLNKTKPIPCHDSSILPKKYKPTIPNWFKEWWDKFGPSEQSFLETIWEIYLLLQKNLELPEPYLNVPELMVFFSTQFLTWICKFEYKIQDK